MIKESNKEVNIKMLTLARETRGITQAELADKTTISKTSIHRLEKGTQEVTPEMLDEISKALNYPHSFFYQKADVAPLALSYRKRDNVPAKELSMIEATINAHLLSIEQLFTAGKFPETNIPLLDVLKYHTPEKCAAQLRKAWNVPHGPIENLSKVIEKNGIMLISFDFGTDRVDGRFGMALDKFPVIITNKRLLGDRQRFTLAYQLGHIVMHQYTSPGFERDLSHEANLFAAEFLMPEKDIKNDLQELSLPKLAMLKKKWKVSMQSLVYRAEDIGQITERQKFTLMQLFNQQNIRRREPKELDIAIETYKAIRDIITKYRSKQKLSIDEFAAFLHIEASDFITRYSS